MNFRGLVPNAFTMGNLLCGVSGIILAFHEKLLWSGVLVFAAAFLDFFDGFTARLLKVQGELGKQLDSLADGVTFGVLPAIILFQLCTISYFEYFTPIMERPHFWFSFVCLVAALGAIYRLAVFNIDTEQSENFKGMPTPASAIFVASLPLVLELNYNMNFYPGLPATAKAAMMEVQYLDPWDDWLLSLLFSPAFYIVTALVLAGLNISRIPLFSLKFKSLRWRDNKVRFRFLIGVALLGLLVYLPYGLIFMRVTWDVVFPSWVKNIPFLDWAIVPLVILLYLLIAFIHNLLPKRDEIPG